MKRSKFINRVFALLFASVLVFSLGACSGDDGAMGPEGPRGEQGLPGNNGRDGKDGQDGRDGTDGEDSNANVKSYKFSVLATDWNNGTHSGNGNTSNGFVIPSSYTGGIKISNPNYVVLAYGKINSNNISFSHERQLPFTVGIDNNYGLRFDLTINREELRMAKTFHGWDSSHIPAAAHRPDKVDFRIVMIEI